MLNPAGLMLILTCFQAIKNSARKAKNRHKPV
jgi:hypothetical protein